LVKYFNKTFPDTLRRGEPRKKQRSRQRKVWGKAQVGVSKQNLNTQKERVR